jgi:CO/xanthine dehydrogenase FAD-binding subunit
MPRTRFQYFSPRTLADAIELLEKYDNARVMAGGTDLLLRLRKGLIKAQVVVGLKNIQGLNLIEYAQNKGLTIGAMALLADVARHSAIRKHYPSIAEAARKTANVQIRNMGTVIGNLCNASPSADNIPMLLVLDSLLHIIGPDGKRELPIRDFFKGPGMTHLGKHEIVASIHVPPPQPHTGTSYLSLSARGQVDCTAVGVAVKLTMDGNICRDVKIAVGACAPTPLRVPEAEACLTGKRLSNTKVNQAAKIAVAQTRPIDDVRASASYRATVVEVLVKRALQDAAHSVQIQ